MGFNSEIDTSFKSAVKNSGLVFMGTVLSILLWFNTKLLLVRFITKEELGIYSLAVAVASVISLIATLGISAGNSRYIAIFLGEGKKEDAKAMATASVQIGAIISLCTFFAIFFLSGFIAKHVFYMPQFEASLRAISLFIPFSIMVNIINGILRGYNIVMPKVYIDVFQPLLFLILLSIIFFFKLPFIWIVFAFVISLAAVFIAIIAKYPVTKNVFSSLRKNKYRLKLLKFSAPLLIGALAYIFMNWVDIIMVGRYCGVEPVGTYNIGMSLAKLLFFPIGALEFVFMAVAGSLFAKHQYSELNRKYQVLTKWNFAVTFPIFFILFFFPEMTIGFLFGDNYLDAVGIVRILSAGFLFHAFLGANITVMIVMGSTRGVMNISIFGGVLNIILNYILIKHMSLGITGAAIATATSFVIINIITSVVIYTKNKIHPITPEYIKPIISSIFIGLIIYAVAKSIPLYLWMLPLYLVLYLGGYLISLIVTKSVEKEDIEMFEAMAGKVGIESKIVSKIIDRYHRQLQ